MSDEHQNGDLAHLIELLSDDIAADYGLEPKFFRGSVEDVLVALSGRGIEPTTIRKALEVRAQQISGRNSRKAC